jgi:hypothetical protein
VASFPTPPDNVHWQNGVTYRTLCPTLTATLSTYDECISVTGTTLVTGAGAPPAPAAKTDNVTPVYRGATPFTVYTEFDCSAVGNPDFEKAGTDSLTRVEPWEVERAFWTGLSGGQTVVFPHLAANAQVVDAQNILLQTAATQVTGTALHVTQALGALEGQLADCYDGVGVIHIPQRALPRFDALGLIHKNGPVLTTLNGNQVAVGAGYPGSAPDGTAASGSTVWIYATGAVFGYRSPVRVLGMPGAMDRAKNTIKMIAERTYVLGWDCCHFAVPVDIS